MNSHNFDDFHSQYNNYLSELNLSSCQHPARDRILIPEPYGSGTIIRTKLRPGIELVVAECHLNSPRSLQFQSDIPMVELSFWFRGISEINLSGNPIHIRNNHSQLAFSQNLYAEMSYTGEENILACEIRIAEAQFNELIELCGTGRQMDLKRITGNDPVRVFQQTIEPAEQLRAQQLLSCPYVPALRRMYWEGKAMELLVTYMQRHLFDNPEMTGRNGKWLSRTDLDHIRTAAQILVNRIDDPPTVPELSRLAGVSEFKLKAGFRELYDTTVFGYLREKRMERALILLEMGKVNVYEAAIATGYSNPSHFAFVFRKKFGFNPSDWRKNNRQR